MSSLPSLSFIDDGVSLPHRLPRAARSSASITASDSSTCTGSLIDDGADLLPSTRGFGRLNPRFYQQRVRRPDSHGGVWDAHIGRAVGGDIGRSLARLRGVADVDVDVCDKDKKRVKNVETVRVLVPRRWGEFVIKGDDGRVVIVGKEGEFDSGAMDEREKWVERVPRRKENAEKNKRGKKEMQSIEESEYEDVPAMSHLEAIGSPTDFFMTGGAGGRLARSVASSRKHSIEKPKSVVYSLPGSCPLSPTKSTSMSGTSTSTASGKSLDKAKSHRSSASKRLGKGEVDNASIKSYSTYKPAMVEDAADTASESAAVVGEKKWGGSEKGSTKPSPHSWANSQKGSIASTKDRAITKSTSCKTSSNNAWNPASPAPAIQNWIESRVKTVSEASTPSSYHASFRAPSEASWDGLERPRTISDRGVVGSGSEASWSRVSRASSRKSSRYGWGGSERSKRANVGEETDSEGGRGDWERVRVRVRDEWQ
jgi:hypothetical protein